MLRSGILAVGMLPFDIPPIDILPIGSLPIGILAAEMLPIGILHVLPIGNPSCSLWLKNSLLHSNTPQCCVRAGNACLVVLQPTASL